MKKKWLLLFCITVSSLTACSKMTPNNSGDEFSQDENEDKSTSISIDSLDNRYPNMIITKENDNAIIGNSTTEDRLDSREFEYGLMTIGMESFGEDSYLLADNNLLLDNEKIDDLLSNNLINVMVFTYYEVNDSNATPIGIVVGVQISSSYSARQSSKATEVSNEILDILRSDSDNADIPVVFAIFQQRLIDEEEFEVPSGNFVLKSEATTNSTLEKWIEISEQYYFYPSSELTSSKESDVENVDNLLSKFREKINTPEYIGVTGVFKYTDNELEQINLTFNGKFDSKMLIVIMTEAIAELVQSEIPETVGVEIIISSDTQEALIVKNKNEDVFTHVY